MLNAPVRGKGATNAAQKEKQANDWLMLYALGMIVFVNVCFVIGYSFMHQVDTANASKRVAREAHIRESMRDDPTERCKLTLEDYTVRNGRADPITSTVVTCMKARCPFYAAVYDTTGKRDKSKPYDIVSNSIIVTNQWEPRESAMIEDLAAESLFVDIGANLGWHTLLALSLGHSVIAFEPMLANIKLLNHSLCLNPSLGDNLELHQVALTDMRDCTIGSSADNTGDGILLCGPEQVGARERVVTGRLDYYLHTGVQIDLMKIDVEGHELSVVRSGATIFERKRGHVPPSYIISEFAPGSMEKLGYSPVEYLDFFANRDYQIAYRDEPQSASDLWTAASGSPKAHHVLSRSQFVEFARKIWDTSITIEMSLLDFSK